MLYKDSTVDRKCHVCVDSVVLWETALTCVCWSDWSIVSLYYVSTVFLQQSTVFSFAFVCSSCFGSDCIALFTSLLNITTLDPQTEAAGLTESGTAIYIQK